MSKCSTCSRLYHLNYIGGSIQYADKTTLGQSAVLGLIQDNHLTQNQFNWLGTIFCPSYTSMGFHNALLTRFQTLAISLLNIRKILLSNASPWGNG